MCAAVMADEVTKDDEAKAFYERGNDVRFPASLKLRSERPPDVCALKRNGGFVKFIVHCCIYTDTVPSITRLRWQQTYCPCGASLLGAMFSHVLLSFHQGCITQCAVKSVGTDSYDVRSFLRTRTRYR
jgi:hypothetical protein